MRKASVGLAVACVLIAGCSPAVTSVDQVSSASVSPSDTGRSPSPTAAGSPSPTTGPAPTADPDEPPDDKAADARLLRAAAAGDVAEVRAALGSGADVAATDDSRATPLVLAAYGNHVDVARVLVEAGADVNHKDRTEQSAYLIATSEVGDDPRLLDLMLRSGARVQAKDSFNGTGLIRAAERGFPTIIGRLLDAGIQVDHVNELGWTALHEAIILGKGTEPYVRVVEQLVDAGADAMLPSQRDGVRPIEHAQRRGFAAIETLLRKAAREMTPDTRLLRAAADGSVVAVEAALADGADVEARDDRERTALLLAVTRDHVDVARVLVARDADVNAVDDQRDTPFLVTGVTGSVEMLDALLPGRPDTALTNRFGGVSVIPASERGHAEYVAAVLDRTDIDVNHVNDLGWTALLEAVILGDGGRRHQEVVRILLANGADPSIADRDGVTALQHARDRGFTELVALLSG
jgi:ankyrin repeat protein